MRMAIPMGPIPVTASLLKREQKHENIKLTTGTRMASEKEDNYKDGDPERHHILTVDTLEARRKVRVDAVNRSSFSLEGHLP